MIWLLLACTGEPTPPPTPPAAPVTTAPAAPAPSPTLWSVENIDQLQPRAPARTSAVPRPIPLVEAYDRTLGILGGVVEHYDGDPENPWAIAHGILARGAAFRLDDGREAIPHLFATYAEPRTAGTRTLLGFPRELGKVRVEPHTDLLLKNLTEAGVDPATTYPTRQGTVPVADLYRWTLLKTFLVAETNHSSYDDPNDMAWNVQALAAWAPGDELQWLATDGTPMDMDFLADFLAAVVTQESAFMFEAMQKGQPFRREGQRLFSYTCGGSHLVQFRPSELVRLERGEQLPFATSGAGPGHGHCGLAWRDGLFSPSRDRVDACEILPPGSGPMAICEARPRP